MEGGDACLTSCPGPGAQRVHPATGKKGTRQKKGTHPLAASAKCPSSAGSAQACGVCTPPWQNPIGQPHVWGTPLFQLS